MKLKGAKAVHYDSGPNMTPLVDVVMVILIFLMLTGSFGAAARFLPSSMPITQSGKSQMDPNKIPKVPDPRLEIFISSLPGDTFRARIGSGDYFMDGDKLADALTAKRLQHEASGQTRDHMQIILNPRLSTRYSDIIAVYQAAMKAEWPKIGFQSAKD